MSAPMRKGEYYYYKRTLQGKEYAQRCRLLIPNAEEAPPSVYDTMPTGPDAPEEHVILDENVKAQAHDYYVVGAFKVSPNNKLVAYTEDTKGDEIYTAYVIDAQTGAPVGNPLLGLTSYLEWAGDDSLVYITMDGILRPDKVLLLPFSMKNKHSIFGNRDGIGNGLFFLLARRHGCINWERNNHRIPVFITKVMRRFLLIFKLLRARSFCSLLLKVKIQGSTSVLMFQSLKMGFKFLHLV